MKKYVNILVTIPIPISETLKYRETQAKLRIASALQWILSGEWECDGTTLTKCDSISLPGNHISDLLLLELEEGKNAIFDASSLVIKHDYAQVNHTSLIIGKKGAVTFKLQGLYSGKFFQLTAIAEEQENTHPKVIFTLTELASANTVPVTV